MKSKILTIAALAAMFTVTITARAQVMEKKTLTIDGARKVIAAAVAEAKKLNAPGGVIAIVDDGGNLMALERLDGTFAAGATISIGKARTAALFKKPTKVFEDVIKNGRTAMVALENFTPLQGGVPLMLGEDVIGAIGVSGAASAQQDEEIALAGAAVARTLKAGLANGALSRTVTHIDHAMVTSGFAKGAVLVSMGNYMIHASHREKDGIAEVHTL